MYLLTTVKLVYYSFMSFNQSYISSRLLLKVKIIGQRRK